VVSTDLKSIDMCTCLLFSQNPLILDRGLIRDPCGLGRVYLIVWKRFYFKVFFRNVLK
jgi:hypothetical protein